MASFHSKCGCITEVTLSEDLKDWKAGIHYCPLHAAAGSLLEACQAVLFDCDVFPGGRLMPETKAMLEAAITAATKKEGG